MVSDWSLGSGWGQDWPVASVISINISSLYLQTYKMHWNCGFTSIYGPKLTWFISIYGPGRSRTSVEIRKNSDPNGRRTQTVGPMAVYGSKKLRSWEAWLSHSKFVNCNACIMYHLFITKKTWVIDHTSIISRSVADSLDFLELFEQTPVD